jgi:hypothetical protein
VNFQGVLHQKQAEQFFFDLSWETPPFLGLDRPSLATEMMLMFACLPLNVMSGLFLHLHVICMKLTVNVQGVLHQKQAEQFSSI